MANASAEDEYELRSRVLRHILRSGAIFGFFGIRYVRRQASLLQKANAKRREPIQLQLIATELQRLVDITNLPLVAGIYSECSVLFIANHRMHDVLQRLNSLGQMIQLADVEPGVHRWRSRTLDAFISTTAKSTGFARTFIRRCISETPEYWWTLAEAVNRHLEIPSAVLHVQAAIGKGRAALVRQDLGQAKALFHEALSIAPDSVTAHEGLAITYTRLRQIDTAISYYERAITLGSIDPIVFNNFSWYRHVLGQVSEVEQVAAQRAVELAPVSPFLDTLASVLLKLNKPARAEYCIRLAIEEDGSKQALHARHEEIMTRLRSDQSSQALSKDDLKAGDDSKLDLDREPDSGISLAGEPLPRQDKSAKAMEMEAQQNDDEFNLTPLLELDDEKSSEASGSQVIALDSEEGFSDSGLMSDSFADPLPSPAPAPEFMLDQKPWLATASDLLDGHRQGPNLNTLPCTDEGWFQQTDTAPKDAVQCTVFAPPFVRRGESLLVQVISHLRGQSDTAEARARAFDGESRKRGVTSLATRIERKSTLTFELAIPQLEVYGGRQTCEWNGDIESVSFEVRVPKGIHTRSFVGTVLVSQNTIPIGQIRFSLRIKRKTRSPKPDACGVAQWFLSAFISYASKDRPEVLRRVQMLTAVGIEYFQDVLNLKPGELWESTLYKRIAESDIMFLFWSTAAKESEWVAREWKYALSVKPADAIRPVVIEGPPIPQPPVELQHLHFSDHNIYFIAAGEAAR